MRPLFAALSLFVILLGIDAAPVASPAPAGVAPKIAISSCKVITGQPLIGSAFQIGLAARFTNNDPAVYQDDRLACEVRPRVC